MNKNLRILLASFLLSLPFWWFLNIGQAKVSDFLFWKIVGDDYDIFLAQVLPHDIEFIPKPHDNFLPLKLTAKAATSVFISSKGRQKILFEKNINLSLPIASLTKLMTAEVFLEYYNKKDAPTIQSLYLLLINSDNESAEELARIIGRDAFIDLMNLEAKKIGLINTYFFNPTGLDPDTDDTKRVNYSTVLDLVKLAQYISENKPLIWKISTIESFNGNDNTNLLLREIPGIIGGKTGSTDMAGECLLLVLKSPGDKNGYLINIILGSENRFEDMKSLIKWVQDTYQW